MVGFSGSKYMARNVSRTLGEIAECRAKASAVQEKSLHSLAEVVLDNRLSPGDKLAMVFVPSLIPSAVFG